MADCTIEPMTLLDLILVPLVSGAASFFGAYLNAKAKNLADKEDIKKLTQITEEVKRENAALLKALDAKQQLRMAAIDRRLAAHQEAFELWSRVTTYLWEPQKIEELKYECWTWWIANCLYMEPAARTAFRVAFASAPDHRMVVETATNDDAGVKAIQESWARIWNAGDLISRAVALPGLTADDERLFVQLGEENKPD